MLPLASSRSLCFARHSGERFGKRLSLILLFGATVTLLAAIGPTFAAPPSQWAARGVGGGGALFAPSISPFNANELYIACDMSQQFHSTDLGQTWSYPSYLELQANRNSQVQFTSNPQILYSIDWSNVGLDNAQRPTKSTDGGTTWTPLAGDPTGGDCWSIHADRTNANNLIVASYSQIYFSSNGGQSFGPPIYTDNSGNGAHVAGVFWDTPNIYVVTLAGMLVSANGGASFNPVSVGGIPAGSQLVSVAGARQNGVTRFIGVAADGVYQGITGGDHYSYRGVYRLDYGQANWTPAMTGIAAGDHPFYAAMSPTNNNIAYLGGGGENGVPTVYKTVNGGQNWQQVFLTEDNQNIATGWAGDGGDRGWGYPEYVLGLAVAPTNPSQVVITDLGAVHLTTDGGANWRQAYVASADQNAAGAVTPKGKSYHSIGLENTTSWNVCWSDANNVMAGFSDIRGIRSTDAGATWSFNYSGPVQNSMYWIVKSPSGTLYAATASAHDMYQSTYLTDARIDGGTGAVLFSTDKGQTWQQAHNFGHVVVWVALDPNNPNRLYASVAHSTEGGIYVTNNINAGAASTWTKLAAPPRTEGHPFNIHVLNDGTLVCSYSGRRTGTGFTASSGVFISTTNGQSWVDRSHSGMLYWTKDVVIDPTDPTQNTWYAGVYSGWGGPPNGLGGLYKTTNRGQSWTRINANDRVGSCTVNPANPNELYFTTEVDGLWYSSNATSASPNFTRVASYPFRQPERVFFNPFANEVWVTSFGSGLRVGTTSGGSGGSLQFSAPSFSVNESGPVATVTVTRSGGSSGAVGITYATAGGGTATAGADYTVVTNTLSWAAGDTSNKSFTIAINNDNLDENNETVNLTLTNATGGATLGNQSTAVLTIVDNDPAGPGVTISGRVANHSNAGIPNVQITRTGGSNVVTNANGDFVFTNVVPGNYTIAPLITPSLQGVTLYPPSRSVSVTSSNLTNQLFQASFSVSGRVANHSGVGIPNIQVKRVAGASTVSVFTDSNGNYKFTDVRSGSYTLSPVITPAMTGMSFTPVSTNLTVATANVTNQNFIGMFSVSGRIATSANTAIPNVLVRLSIGGSSTTVLTDSTGNYRFANVRSGTYTITPTLTGRTFTPAARTSVVVSTLNVGNQNFTGSG